MWDDTYRLLCQFAEREGHAVVPHRWVEDGVALGNWVTRQRDYRRKGRLSAQRQRRLEQVPGWSWSPHTNGRKHPMIARARTEKITDANLDELAEAVWIALWGLGAVEINRALNICAEKLHADGLIESKYIIRGGATSRLLTKASETAVALGFLDRPKEVHVRAVIRDAEYYEPDDWEMCVKNTLIRKNRKRPDAIRAGALWARDNLGLKFVEVQRSGPIWQRLNAAISRLLRRGDLKPTHDGIVNTAAPPHDTDKERKKKRKVSSWNIRRREAWNEGYRRLTEYVARTGTARVPREYTTEDGYHLGSWATWKRAKKKELPDEYKKALEELPGWVWKRQWERSWDYNYTQLLRFVEREGHAMVPCNHIENIYKLGKWVDRQLSDKNRLSEEKKAALERLPGWVWRVR